MEQDALKIYRGEDFVVSKHIIIHQATLNEICDYGENDYFSMLYQMTATPQSMKAQLWDIGIDYTRISPFELFYHILYKLYPREKTGILFGDLDFTNFQQGQRRDNGAPVLYQTVDKEPVLLDEYTYHMIMDYLRQVHMIYKDEKLPANETTKMILIEDAREEAYRNQNRNLNTDQNKAPQRQSQLKNLISSMINSEGFKYDHSRVWDMKINAFMDSVKRISKIKNAELLLQSGYSGFGVNLKDIDKKQLDWLGELE